MRADDNHACRYCRLCSVKETTMNTSQYGASNTHDRGITRRTFAKSAAVLTGVAMSGMGYNFSYAEG